MPVGIHHEEALYTKREPKPVMSKSSEIKPVGCCYQKLFRVGTRILLTQGIYICIVLMCTVGPQLSEHSITRIV